jgi:AcrR family transcriptional regulator
VVIGYGRRLPKAKCQLWARVTISRASIVFLNTFNYARPVIALAVPLASKGELRRERILDVALGLFRQHGYEATTMRMIAAAAGASLGNSYYYFPSKDHLVQAFYERMHTDLVEACRRILDDEVALRARLRLIMRARLDVLRPYHAVSGTLFRTASDPQSPLNPFSDASGPTRRASIDFLQGVIARSDARLPRDVAATLPHLLWLYELGLVLFWVHDRSPEQRRSYELVDDTTDAIVQLLALANLPGLRTIRKRMLHWVSTLVNEGAS